MLTYAAYRTPLKGILLRTLPVLTEPQTETDRSVCLSLSQRPHICPKISPAHHAPTLLDERLVVRKQTLWSQSPPTRLWSLVGVADERLAARDPAASVSRQVTAQCALDAR